MFTIIILISDHLDFTNYLNRNIHTTFELKKVTEVQVKTIIQGLKFKSSFGYDGISTILLKKLESKLAKH